MVGEVGKSRRHWVSEGHWQSKVMRMNSDGPRIPTWKSLGSEVHFQEFKP